MGAGIIGLDIIFSESDKSSPSSIAKKIGIDKNELEDYDKILADVIAQTPSIGGYFFDMDNQTQDDIFLALKGTFIEINSNKDSSTNKNSAQILNAKGVHTNIEILQDSFYSVGFLNNTQDSAGVIRRVPLMIKYQNILYPSLALEMVRIFQQTDVVKLHNEAYDRDKIEVGKLNIITDENARLIVNFRGPAHHFPYISASDILHNDVNISDIEGKFILIGTSAVGLSDLKATPYDSLMPGVEIHANVIDNILQDDFLQIPEGSVALNIFIFLGIIILGLILFTFLRVQYSLISFITLSFLLYYFLYYMLFEKYIVLNILFSYLSLILIYLSSTIINFAFITKAQEDIKKVFAKKVSKAVMDDLVNHSDQALLKPRDEVVSIFFSDIRGFTSISEKIGNPHSLIELLNIYMTPMVKEIDSSGGTIDKFIGDAIMAYWNAPLKVKNHADKALKSAINQIKILKTVNKTLEEKYNLNLDIGIGINTGQVTIGDMGSEGRSDYTIIGDQVNLASRLESLNKLYGSNIIISKFTKDELINNYFIRPLDFVKVKGKNQAVEIFEVFTFKSLSTDQIPKYRYALNLYRHREFNKARILFQKLNAQNKSTLYQLYIDRCEKYIKSPNNFSIVETMTTK